MYHIIICESGSFSLLTHMVQNYTRDILSRNQHLLKEYPQQTVVMVIHAAASWDYYWEMQHVISKSTHTAFSGACRGALASTVGSRRQGLTVSYTWSLDVLACGNDMLIYLITHLT